MVSDKEAQTTYKRNKVKVNDTIVEQQEDRSLFARMMMVCHTRPEINIAEAVGQYELTEDRYGCR